MISTLRGELQSVSALSVVVSVQGVGFQVFVPQRTAALMSVGEESHLFTKLIVKEDELSLYGFAEQTERDTFDLLCGVNGVGPKSAIGILNALSVDEIAQAVSADDDTTFRQVSGIGPKTAKLITLTLQGKLAAPHTPAATRPGDNRLPAGDETAIVQALVGLGWSEKVAKRGVAEVLSDLGTDEDTSVASLVKKALVLLGPSTVRETAR